MKTFAQLITENADMAEPLHGKPSSEGFVSKLIRPSSKEVYQSDITGEHHVRHGQHTVVHEKRIRPGRYVTVTHPSLEHMTNLHRLGEPGQHHVSVSDSRTGLHRTHGAIYTHADGTVTSHDLVDGKNWRHKDLQSATDFYVKKAEAV